MPEKKQNYYELLDVNPAATDEEIERAFRDKLYEYHPDHNPDKAEWAHVKTSEAVEAHRILSDPIKRKIYNFLIFYPLKEKTKEYKFGIFQGGDKKRYEDAMIYFNEGVEAFEREKGKALLKFQQSFDAFKTAEAMFNMGVIYVATNKLADAVRTFNETVRLDQENPAYERTTAKLQELIREIDKAKKIDGQ